MRPICALTTTLLFVAWGCCACAFALDPSLEVSQYAHTSWKVRDGFVKGAIFSIAQTPDGYLWLGTEFGLARFDGVRAVPWEPPTGEQLPSNFIQHLLGAQDGALWIGTHRGLARWKDGKLTNYPELAELNIFALIQDHEGTVWIGAYGSKAGNLCAAKGSTMHCYGAGPFGDGVGALYEDRKGNLWVAAETGLWRWAAGTPEHYLFPGGFYVSSLIEDDGGALLVASSPAGLKQLVGGKIEDYRLPGVAGQFNPTYFLRSTDGSIWVACWQGLLHLHSGHVDRFAAADGLSGDPVNALFEDREGNVWIGTSDGLDRFREVAVPLISESQGLLHSAAWSVQATPDGSIWIATADGLNRWQNGHVTVYRTRKAPAQSGRGGDRELSKNGQAGEILNSGLTGDTQSLGQDDRGRLWVSTTDGVFYFEHARFVRVPGVPGGITFSITGDGHGNVWISNWEQGLFSWTEGSAVQRIPWPRFGQKRGLDLISDRRGGLWLGFSRGGVAYVEDGQVGPSYSTADGLGDGDVYLRLGSSGELWAATEGGLSRIKDGHVVTLSSKNGLPCDAVHWSMEDDDHAVWLYMPCGLVRIERSELDAWVSDEKHVVQTTIFDISDGVRTYGIPSGYFPHVTKSSDGKIWFPSRDGVSVIDPRHLPFNKLPPPVHIESVVADGKNYDVSYGLRLPPHVRDLSMDYTALSLVVPEKVHFRVKLEGQDNDWRELVNVRHVEYTNLPPRSYRFRVIACNNSGVWNQTGDSFEFSIAPAYYQKTWFRLLCVVAFLAMLWALYQRRLHIIRRQYAVGLEATVGERMRVARELHDTLLQSFQGAIFLFQAARNLLLRKEDNAMEALDEAIQATEEAIQEGRSAIRDLRPEPAAQRDLPELLNAVGNELATAHELNGSAPAYRVVVEGKQQDLSPMLQDEVYRIAREVIRNAFAHAAASHIEVEIRYDQDQLRLRVRDDGKGIGPKVLAGGQSGHFGIPGMRERSQRIGARLDFWSEMGAGTEVELAVPASMAYQKRRDGRGFRLFHRAGRDDQRS